MRPRVCAPAPGRRIASRGVLVVLGLARPGHDDAESARIKIALSDALNVGSRDSPGLSRLNLARRHAEHRVAHQVERLVRARPPFRGARADLAADRVL